MRIALESDDEVERKKLMEKLETTKVVIKVTSVTQTDVYES